MSEQKRSGTSHCHGADSASDSATKFHCTLEWRETIPSTMSAVFERAGREDFHGYVVAAHFQSQGRGRRGRTWETKPGNLTFSIGFRVPDAEQATLPFYPLCTGVVAQTAISRFLAPEAARDLFVKWPNDLAWRKQKLMGILSQARNFDGYTYLVIGIGINVAWAPEQLPAVALAEMPLAPGLAAATLKKEEVLAAILAEVESTYPRWREFSFVRREWEARAGYLGKRVYFGLLEREAEMEAATALGLHESGALRVRLESSGEERLLSTEDLSLRLG